MQNLWTQFKPKLFQKTQICFNQLQYQSTISFIPDQEPLNTKALQAKSSQRPGGGWYRIIWKRSRTHPRCHSRHNSQTAGYRAQDYRRSSCMHKLSQQQERPGRLLKCSGHQMRRLSTRLLSNLPLGKILTGTVHCRVTLDTLSGYPEPWSSTILGSDREDLLNIVLLLHVFSDVGNFFPQT